MSSVENSFFFLVNFFKQNVYAFKRRKKSLNKFETFAKKLKKHLTNPLQMVIIVE